MRISLELLRYGDVSTRPAPPPSVLGRLGSYPAAQEGGRLVNHQPYCSASAAMGMIGGERGCRRHWVTVNSSVTRAWLISWLLLQRGVTSGRRVAKSCDVNRGNRNCGISYL